MNVDDTKSFSYVVDYTDNLSNTFGVNGRYQFTETGNLSGFGINRRNTNNTTDNFYNTFLAWEGDPDRFAFKMPRRFENNSSARINTFTDYLGKGMMSKSGSSRGDIIYSVVNAVITKLGKEFLKSTEIDFDCAVINGAFRSQENAFRYLESQQENFQGAKVIETESDGQLLYRISLHQTNDRYEAEAMRTTSRNVEGAEESWILTTVKSESE